ncbi:hypothetical protein P7C73_g6195, partial [Tremellales sp. Uapishka_1]
MQDLSSISKALETALSSKDDESSLSALLAEYLGSSNPAVRETMLETLLEVLNQGQGEELTERRNLILESTALDYLPLILPLLTEKTEPTVTSLASIISAHGQPREVILALNQVVQDIEEKLESFVVSNDEDEFADEDGEVDYDSLALQLELALRCYAAAVARLTNKRSTPTLLSITGTISSLLPLMVRYMSADMSRASLRAICELVDCSWKWTLSTEDAGGEQRAMLTQLLYMGITLLAPRVNAKLIDRWFLTTFPKFKGLHEEDSDEEWQIGQEVLDLAYITAQTLGFTRDSLLDLLTHPSTISVHSSLAALILLSSSLPTLTLRPKLATDEPIPLPTSLLSDSMPILSAAISSSAVEAGVVWVWNLVSRSCVVEHDSATLLIELLVPLTSYTISPTVPLAILKLIGGLIDASTPSDQIMLFHQLLEEANPFKAVRVRALTLLKEQLSKAAALPPTAPSILTPDLLAHLAPIIFTVSSEPLPLDAFVQSTYPNWYTDSLTLLWFLLKIDGADTTGIHKAQFIDGYLISVEELVRGYKTEMQVEGREGDDGEVAFMLDRLEDGLARVEEERT